MAGGGGSPQILPYEFVLEGSIVASPLHTVAVRLIAESTEGSAPAVDIIPLYFANDPILRWKRDESEPFGFVISELELSVFVPPTELVTEWPDLFQNESYGRFRVEVDVNSALFWFGYIMPQSLQILEEDNLRIVNITCGDGLASLKEKTIPYQNEYYRQQVTLWIRSAFAPGSAQAYPFTDVITEISDSAWRFTRASVDYVLDNVNFKFSPFGFIDPKTGVMPNWFDALNEIAKRFMLIICISFGRVKFTDVLSRETSFGGMKRTVGSKQNAALVTQCSLEFPLTYPSSEILQNSDPEFTDWRNDIDYLSKWTAPWTLDDQVEIVPAKYVQVIRRSSGLTIQDNIVDGVSDQKAALEQTELQVDLLRWTSIQIDVKVTCTYTTYTYDPSAPNGPTITYESGPWELEVQVGEFWYNPDLELWQETAYSINSIGYTYHRILFTCALLPPKPGKLTIRIKNPLGDPTDIEVSALNPEKTACSFQVCKWAKAIVKNALGHFLPQSIEEFPKLVKSRTTSVFVPQTQNYAFRHTVREMGHMRFPFFWPDTNQFHLSTNLDIQSIRRTDNNDFTSPDLDTVWLEFFMNRYGSAKPIQYFETEFWPLIITPVEVISLESGRILRNPVELEVNLANATAKGKWEIDPIS